MNTVKTLLLIAMVLMSVASFAAYAEENNTDGDGEDTDSTDSGLANSQTDTSANTDAADAYADVQTGTAYTDVESCMDSYLKRFPQLTRDQARRACSPTAVTATGQTAVRADEKTDTHDDRPAPSARPADSTERCMDALTGVITDEETRKKWCEDIRESRDLCIKRLVERDIAEERARLLCNRFLGAPVAVAQHADARLDQIKERFDGVLKDRAERIEANDALSEEQKEQMLMRVEKLEAISMDVRKRLDNRTLLRLQHVEEKHMERIAKLPERDIEKLAKLDRATQKRLLDRGEEAIKNELAHLKEVRATQKEELFRKREIQKGERDRINEQYREFKGKIKEQRDELRELRDTFVKDKDTDRGIEAAKAYLDRAIDVAITDIEILKKRVQQSDDLEQSVVDAVIEKLDEHIAELDALKEKVNAATTKEELKALAKELREKWNKAKHRLAHANKALVHAKIGEIVTRSKYLEAKLDRILDHMEEAGKDTTEVDELIDTFSTHVAAAQQHFKDAKNLVILAIVNADDNKTRSEIERLTRLAHEELIASHEVLKEIVRVLREQEVSLDVSDADITVVVEEETETDAEVETDAAGTETEVEAETDTETSSESDETSGDTSATT